MEGRKTEFKWFGEGFDGFPKYLPEDCVEYSLYIIDPKLKDWEIRSRLRQVQEAAKALIKDLLQGFIWQRQGFKLELVEDKGSILLRGQTSYGDSVEDEWLIVYLLVELSKKFPNVWIRIIDTDGEFLLIEAANVLPRWMNPEVAGFRVWLNKGNLLIIPRRDASNAAAGKRPAPDAITLDDALSFLRENQSKLLHSPMIEAEAFYRLQKYPMQIENSMHHSLIVIPRKLAFILRDNASYISPAIEAFYLRDPVSLRLLRDADTQKLFFPPEDLVTMSVKFTRVGFAQVRSQQFIAPSQWASHFSSEPDVQKSGRIETGMKVTCGFEMLLLDPQNTDVAAVREIKILLEDLKNGDDCLPSDLEISEWGYRNDDESWLNIDFTDFESELTRKGTKASPHGAQSFGDKNTQENLRKIVTRFEEFLNDNRAGVEGAEDIDDMDRDDESSDFVSDGADSESEDKEISFDEDQFTEMIRDMMGMSAGVQRDVDLKPDPKSNDGIRRSEETHAVPEEDDEEYMIKQDMQAIERELHDAGAIHHDMQPLPDKATRQTHTGSFQGQIFPSSSTVDESDTETAHIDYNLAKNLLKSFQSQNGASGPAGNFMSIAGMKRTSE